MKDRISTILLFLMLFVGLSLLLYPTVSEYWNSFHQSRAIATYIEEIEEIDNSQYEQMLNTAREYNDRLAHKTGRWLLTAEEEAEYNDILNIANSGIMGYIEIPGIKVSLPIYHGTDDAVLQVAIGHIPGSSLPVGGVGTHAVVSGHRGLPSAKLFSDLDKVNVKDKFIIRVLNEIFTYEVDQVLIVEPNETSALEIEADKDYCTLVTCTPYGVNTHRLLVRGHRVENTKTEEAIRVSADAVQVDKLIIASALAAPVLLVLFVIMMITTGKSNK